MPDNQLAALLALRGSESMRNPVTRFALGLPLGSRAQQPSQPRSAFSQSQTASGVRDKLLARIRTVKDTGFAVPGPGVLPGYSLRPEVRQMFAEQGGVAGFDVSNLSPDEQKGLAFILDPKWVNENTGGGGT
jgi:hypothetical protein